MVFSPIFAPDNFKTSPTPYDSCGEVWLVDGIDSEEVFSAARHHAENVSSATPAMARNDFNFF